MHLRCTACTFTPTYTVDLSVVLLLRLPCTDLQHARHLLLYYRLPSCTTETYEFRSTVHLLTCTARTVIQSANRASPFTRRYARHIQSSRRSVHCSFVVEYNTYYVVYYDRPRQLRQLRRLPRWEELRRTSICCGCSPYNCPAPDLTVMNGSHCSGL